MTEPRVTRVRAVVDPRMQPTVNDLTPLVYSDGNVAHAASVPGHVRGASALRRQGGRLVIVQDDVNVLVYRHAGGQTDAVLLPPGPDGQRVFDDRRGNKHAKMDLEACATLPDGRLVAFGSGSTRNRERLVVLDDRGSLRIVEAPALYAALRDEPAFAGSELNVEGAVIVSDALRLFQRGNGARTPAMNPVNATGDLPLTDFVRWLDGDAPLPRLRRIVQYDLGERDGIAYTFTDAAVTPDGPVVFLACAEASPDVYRDGEVLGCRFGVIDGDAVRVADIRHADGSRAAIKLEGIEPWPDRTTLFDVVGDCDRPDEPALHALLRIVEST